MPKVDNSILSKRDQIVSDIEKIVDPKNVLSHIDEIKPYETDALGTTFILFSLQYFKILLTSLTVSGKTTINGTCL